MYFFCPCPLSVPNIEMKLQNEDKARIFFNALPNSYEDIQDVIPFGRDQTITFMCSAQFKKEISKRKR